jgi:hypothetical protein
MRVESDSFGEFVVSVGKEIVLMLVQAFVRESQAKIVVGDCLLLWVLYLQGNFRRAILDRLPVAGCKTYLDHLALAGETLSAVLFVSLSEVPKRQSHVPLLQLVKSLLISLLRFLASWAFSWTLPERVRG